MEAKKRQGARTDIQELIPECEGQARDFAGIFNKFETHVSVKPSVFAIALLKGTFKLVPFGFVFPSRIKVVEFVKPASL